MANKTREKNLKVPFYGQLLQSQGVQNFFLFLLDALGLSLLSYLIFFFAGPISPFIFIGISGITVTLFYLLDLYHVLNPVKFVKIPWKIFLTIVVSILSSVVLTHFLKEAYGLPWREALLRPACYTSFLVFFLWSTGLRFGLLKWIPNLQKKYLSWLVVGSSKEILQFEKDKSFEGLPGKVDFFNVSEFSRAESSEEKKAILKKLNQKIQMSSSGVVVGNLKGLPEVYESMMNFRLQGHRVHDFARFYESLWLKLPIFHLGRNWWTRTTGFEILNSSFFNHVKFAVDFAFSLILMVLLSPVFLVTALLIKLEDGGPVFYQQVRLGQRGQPFKIIKFRSMVQNAEKNGAQWAQVNDNRITKMGKFIRLTRVDELPQLINVLKGEMSLIGPRPERPEFTKQLAESIPFFEQRLLVKPGITGLAQVKYPYGASVDDSIHKLQYDLYYIKNYSFLLDTIVCLKTLKVIFLGKGR